LSSLDKKHSVGGIFCDLLDAFESSASTWGNMPQQPLCMRLCRPIKHSWFGVVNNIAPYHELVLSPFVAVLVISKMFEQKCYRWSFNSCTVGKLCAQFDTRAVCFTFMLHGFWMRLISFLRLPTANLKSEWIARQRFTKKRRF
jgi:hypothetical protein